MLSTSVTGSTHASFELKSAQPETASSYLKVETKVNPMVLDMKALSLNNTTSLEQVEAASRIQRVTRGYQCRTSFNPKIRHATLDAARKGVIKRASQTLGNYQWGDPMALKAGQNRVLFLSVCKPDSPEGRMYGKKLIEPDLNGRTSVAQAMKNISGPERVFASASLQTTMKPPENRRVLGPNFFSSMVHAPQHLLRAYHEKLATDKNLSMNCVQFVLMTLYQEGLVSFKSLQNPDFSKAIKAEHMESLDKVEQSLEPGDILLYSDKKSGELTHCCLFHSFDDNDDMMVIQLGFSKLTTSVNLDYKTDDTRYNYNVVKLDHFLAG